MHLRKLVDKMCKYKMDPASIVEDTERVVTICSTDGRIDGRTDGQTKTNYMPPPSTSLAGGIKRVVDCVWFIITTESYSVKLF